VYDFHVSDLPQYDLPATITPNAISESTTFGFYEMPNVPPFVAVGCSDQAFAVFAGLAVVSDGEGWCVRHQCWSLM
jgi:hypothetical protein